MRSVRVEVETQGTFQKQSELFSTYKEAKEYFNSLTLGSLQTASIFDKGEKLITK